ncbi:hypothetical protein [Actomonas aquatica]|uniref:Transglutaminase-like domain-containing protein n=1 Tax=Actomonas aquatica TaxID=2866162 RepID=A0ABZ1C8K5_9BACT|nr:hypothetical protein [Opitutus sp. WL0086]WRQ87955.1 hypothetical protein K1X11_000945 [Opitutus sp. WL0086]
MTRWFRICGLWLLAGLLTAHAQLEVAPDDAQRPPTAEWLENVLGAGEQMTWSQLSRAASDAAIVAAEANRSEAMEGWLVVARWARVMGSNQRDVSDRWILAMNQAGLGHPNMPSEYDVPDAIVSERLTEAFVVQLFTDVELSRSLFDLVSPYDNLLVVLDHLQRLQQVGGADFTRYRQLALALALVFDTPPPPTWPHGQVSSRLLPRERPDIVEAFGFWIQSDRRRMTLHRLDQLSAAELKFVVDAAAPFAELAWVQRQPRFDFAGLPRAYDAVEYATARADQGIYLWPGSSYALPAILSAGGICIDQAYFASEVGKARGVPTLLFRGAGLDGRHAWFGYLDARRHWQFDVGRYEEQQLVAGLAFDPQTWSVVNDHELAFLAEGFRRLPAYHQSRAWQYLAAEQLGRGDPAAAVAAAKRATGHETRNVAAWDILSLAEREAGVSAREREGTLRRAAWALQRYPDLHLRFMREVIALMREHGQVSAAAQEERMLARRFTGERIDLAVAQAAERMSRSLSEDPPALQMRVFASVLRQFGPGAGIKAFDVLVEPRVIALLRARRVDEARQVVAVARQTLAPEAGSQLAREFANLEPMLR